MSPPSSPRSPGGSGIRATDVGMHACFMLAGKKVLALIVKDTTHLDGLYTVQLEQAHHGRDDAIQIPESVTSGLRNLRQEKDAKLWIEREKYFGGGYVLPGRRVLNPVGRQAMRQALLSLGGGKELLAAYSNDVEEGWYHVLNCTFHHDEEYAMRGATIFDETLAEGGEEYLYPDLF